MENETKTNSTGGAVKKNVNVETYAGDMAKVIEGSGGGLIKKIIHEQEQHDAENKNISPKSKKNRFFIFFSFLLLFSTFGIIIFLIFFRLKINTVEVVQPITSVIFTDQNYFQDINDFDKGEIVQSILNEVLNTNVKMGGIEALYLTLNKQVVGLREFNKIIKSNFIIPAFPFVEDKFLFGIYKKNIQPIPELQTSDLFILFRIRSFSDAFVSLRSWEEKMFSDLHEFFGIEISSENKELFSKDFIDGRVVNKNARILYGKNGDIVLMYVFADDRSVIITNSEEATEEVILRLTASQISK